MQGILIKFMALLTIRAMHSFAIFLLSRNANISFRTLFFCFDFVVAVVVLTHKQINLRNNKQLSPKCIHTFYLSLPF